MVPGWFKLGPPARIMKTIFGQYVHRLRKAFISTTDSSIHEHNCYFGPAFDGTFDEGKISVENFLEP